MGCEERRTYLEEDGGECVLVDVGGGVVVGKVGVGVGEGEELGVVERREKLVPGSDLG